MRRSFICYSYLALCFSLSFLLNAATVRGGDTLPPGYCEFISEAEFTPIETNSISSLTEKLVSIASVTAPPSGPAPCQLVYVPKSNRSWNFDYQPAAQPIARRVRVIAFWHEGHVQFRTPPLKVIPVRSQKKHIAPVLFWGSDSVAGMTLVLHLMSMEAHAIVQTCIAPIEQIPRRMARMFDDCFRPVY